MNPLIQSKISQAQAEAEKVFNDNPTVDFDTKRIRYGRDLEISLSGGGDITTAEILDRRPNEGPKTLPAATPAAQKAAEIGTWGKPSAKD